MSGACELFGKYEICIKIVENLKVRYYLGDMGVDEGEILRV
jgi:hypothetical protein